MKEFIINEVDLENVPQWFCPSCEVGILESDKSNMTRVETAETMALREHPEFDHEFIQYSINTMLKCNNKKCLESVMAVGKGRVDYHQGYDHNEGMYEYYSERFTPLYFYPHLKIFKSPENVPDEICEMLNKSFSLFFCDSDSCGNKIRACVEILMDSLGSPRDHTDKKGNVRRSTLHFRIENLDKNHSAIITPLLAIKWLGNIGTHGLDGLCKKDTIDAYKILQHILELLYAPTSKPIIDLARNIVAAKGVVP